MMVSRKLIAITVVAVLLILGIGYGFYSSYEAARSLQVTEIRPAGVSYSLTSFDLSLIIRFYNPSSYNLNVNDVAYTVVVEAWPIASGEKSLLTIRSGSYADFPLNVKVTVGDAFNILMEAVKKGYLDVKIQLSGKIPLTLYNVIELPFTVDFMDEKTTYVPVGGNAPTVVVKGYWEKTVIPFGEDVMFVVEAQGKSFTVEIRQDRALQQDRAVAT